MQSLHANKKIPRRQQTKVALRLKIQNTKIAKVDMKQY